MNTWRSNVYRSVRQYLIALISGDRERPSFAWAATNTMPDAYSLDVSDASLLEQQLVDDPYLEVLLDRGGIPLPVLRRAALRGREELHAIAASRIESADLLREVAEDSSSPRVVLAVVQNKAADEEVLLQLLDGPALSNHSLDPPPIMEEIGAAIIDHESCSSEVVRAVAKPYGRGPDFLQFDSVEKKVAKSALLTGEVAHRISSVEAARHLARNPILHFLLFPSNPSLFQELQYSVQKELVSRESAGEELVRRAAEKGGKGLRKVAAQHKELPPETFENLARDDMLMVRRAMAGRTDLPKDLFWRLGEDPHPIVRQTIAFNDSCPRELVERLGRDAAQSVRQAAASQPDCPSSLLAELAGDSSDSVRQSVGKNPNTPASELAHLAFDEDRRVRAAVAQNESTLGAILKKLSVMDVYSVRLGVASNPGARIGTLRNLVDCDAEEHKIRQHAQATLQRLAGR